MKINSTEHSLVKLSLLAVALTTLGGCVSAKPNPGDQPAMAAPAPVPAYIEEVTHNIYALALESGESFGFDSAELSDTAKQDLNQVAAATAAFEKPMVIVTGYTDRIGSEEYNQVLSQRRADAVTAYLVSQGVPAGGITSIGRGASNPLVECAKGMPSQELIACLAPNRRTTVDFPALELVETDSITVIRESKTKDADMIEVESMTLMKESIIE